MKPLATLVVGAMAVLASLSEWNQLQCWRLRERAETSYYAGDFKTTLARYDLVIKRRPGEARSYTDAADTISQYLAGSGQELPLDEFERLTGKALEYYLAGLAASPASAWSYGRIASLAESLQRRRSRDEPVDLARLSGDLSALTPEDRLAEAAWVKAVQIEPRNFYYRDYLGEYYLKRGFIERAHEHLRYAVRLHPILDRHFFLSEFAETSPTVLAAAEQGVADALAAGDLEVSPYKVHRSLAELYRRVGRNADALSQLEAAAKVAPKPYLVDIEIGRLLAENGDDDGALEAFRRATVARPDYYRGWLYLGLALSRAGDHERAIAAARKAHGLNPTELIVTTNLARVLVAGAELDEAAEILEHLIHNAPDSQQTYTQLIQVYEKQNRVSDATRVARLLAERFPEEEAYRRQLEQLERTRLGR